MTATSVGEKPEAGRRPGLYWGRHDRWDLGLKLRQFLSTDLEALTQFRVITELHGVNQACVVMCTHGAYAHALGSTWNVLSLGRPWLVLLLP